MTQTVRVTNVAGQFGVRVFVMDRVVGPDKVAEQHDLPNPGDEKEVTVYAGRYLMVAEYNKQGIPPSPPPAPA